MAEIAIKVQGLGKEYRIGQSQGRFRYKSMRDTVTGILRAPMHRFGGARKHSAKDTIFWALKDVNFEVERGEVLGIIGRNGAGKSTLLKILSRITDPTEGEVEILGRVGSLLEVGTGFHPELTGRENIYLNGAILGMRRGEIGKKFDEIVAFAETEKFLDTPVKFYSSGMYMRLAFAVAAHLDPEILLVDEVLAVGDAKFQSKCMGKMGDVAQAGRTVFFVSHNMSAIQQLCKRVLLLQSGHLVDQGETSQVVSKYLSDATSSSSGSFDLTTHSARSPFHRPYIKGLTLIRDGQPTDRFFPRDSLTIVIDVDPPTRVQEPRLAVAIEDSMGRRIMTGASYFNAQMPPIDGPTRVRCTIPVLNLGTGQYFLSVSIAEKTTGMLDSLDNAARFDVDWNNNYGNGEPYLSVYGPVLANSDWFRE